MFAPTSADTQRAVTDSARLWADQSTDTRLSFPELVAAHARFVRVATDLAGSTRDAHKRAVVYFSIYEDSGGNFMFPMIASHGSLWGVRHTVQLERWLGALQPYSRTRVHTWLGALDQVRDLNRRVFIEIYSTFYFTRFYGRHPRAGELIKPGLLTLYNEVHAAVARGERLSLSERRQIYYTVFVHEQHDIVDPGIHAAAATCPSLLVLLFKHVRPRFAYFPEGKRLHFSDFTSVDQRNREGLKAMDWAEEVGADRVLQAMGEY